MYTIQIYTSRNTSRTHHKTYKSLATARNDAKYFCINEMFPTETFHGAPMTKGKVAITSGSYPNESFELWEYIKDYDKKPLKTEWSN